MTGATAGQKGIFDGIKSAFPEILDLPGGNVIQVHPYKLWVVKGQEVSTKVSGGSVHVLSIGIPSGKTLSHGRLLEETLCEAYEKYGAIQVFDHPAGPHAGIIPYAEENPDRANKLLSTSGVNGWEVYNSLSASSPTPANILAALVGRLDPTNEKSLRFYQRHIKNNFPHVGLLEGSDGHHPWESARAYTDIGINLQDPPKTGEVFIELLRGGIARNKQYSGRRALSFRGYAQHSAIVVLDGFCQKIFGKRPFLPK